MTPATQLNAMKKMVRDDDLGMRKHVRRTDRHQQVEHDRDGQDELDGIDALLANLLLEVSFDAIVEFLQAELRRKLR